MSNPKNLQISYEMFRNVVELVYALENIPLDEKTFELKKRVEAQINEKIDAARRREEYTKALAERGAAPRNGTQPKN